MIDIKFFTVLITSLSVSIVPCVGQETPNESPESRKLRSRQLMATEKLLPPQSTSSILPYNSYLGKAADYPSLSQHPELAQLIAEVELNQPFAISRLERYMATHHHYPSIYPGYLALGNYYYNHQAFDKSIGWYSKLDPKRLTGEIQSEYCFKRGYAHFVQKEFEQAARYFDITKVSRDRFFYPTNYYRGMCHYFEGNFDDAVASFELVSSSKAYSGLIPYYITQIYFAQGKYQELLSYGEQAIQRPDIKEIPNIRHLIGQAYFNLGEYQKALPHLEYYEANTATLSAETFYQLAFTQYRLGYYANAIPNFQELIRLESEMAQVASYYLADCYQREGDLVSARSAYRRTSQMDYIPSMQQEALFNYAKLSAEQGQDREAISSFLSFNETSPFRKEAYTIANKLLLATSDYNYALDIISSLKNAPTAFQESRVLISFKEAIQRFRAKDYNGAAELFEVSFSQGIPELKAQSAFWLARIDHDADRFDVSIRKFQDYFTASYKVPTPIESSKAAAHYYQGYNYIKTEDYVLAADHFKRAIIGFNQNRDQMTDTVYLNIMLADAFIRAGDCFLKEGEYEEALLHYGQSIDRKQAGYVYATYQSGLIYGLQGKWIEKIVAMESISEEHPDHLYADDALYQGGDAYLRLQRYLPAKDAYQKITDNYPESNEYYFSAMQKLGLIHYNLNDFPKALEYYKRILTGDADPAIKNQAMLAAEEIYIKDMNDADGYFAFASSIPGFEVNAFTKDSLQYTIGLNYYEAAQYEDAVNAFNNYLDVFESGYYRHYARYYTGESLVAIKRYQNAIPYYDKVIKEGYNPMYVKALIRSTVLNYHYAKNYNKALDHARLLTQQIIDVEDAYQNILIGMRSAYRASKSQGIDQFAPMVRQHPLASQREIMESWFITGKNAQSKQQIDAALLAYGKVAESSNNEEGAEARYQIARIYFDNKEYEKAEKQCNEVNTRSGGYPYWIARSLLLQSDIYLAKGDLLNARAAAEAVNENFQSDSLIIADARYKLQAITKSEQESSRIRVVPDGQLDLQSQKK